MQRWAWSRRRSGWSRGIDPGAVPEKLNAVRRVTLRRCAKISLRSRLILIDHTTIIFWCVVLLTSRIRDIFLKFFSRLSVARFGQNVCLNVNNLYVAPNHRKSSHEDERQEE